MENFSREKLALAVVAKLKAATTADGKVAFKYVTRRVLLWDAVKTDKRPAVVVMEPIENLKAPEVDRLTEIEIPYRMMVIVDTKANIDNDEKPPISVVNPLIDAIQAAFRADAYGGNQTLGGLVSSAWLDGDIHKDGGDTDGTGIALLTLKVLVPA